MSAPTAADLIVDPHRVKDLDNPAACAAILTALTTTAAAVAAHLQTLPPPESTTEPDHFVTAEDAARQLCMSVDWVKRSDAASPMRVMLGTDLRFSSRQIARYIERHRNK